MLRSGPAGGGGSGSQDATAWGPLEALGCSACGGVDRLRDSRQPGTDVKIVSIDGTRDAVQGIVDGEINAVIESNPRFGPLAFSTAADFFAGEAIPEDIIIEDDEYSPDNAEAGLAEAF